MFFSIGFQFDYVFDWTILKYQQSQLATPPARALVNVFPFYLINLIYFLGVGWFVLGSSLLLSMLLKISEMVVFSGS